MDAEAQKRTRNIVLVAAATVGAFFLFRPKSANAAPASPSSPLSPIPTDGTAKPVTPVDAGSAVGSPADAPATIGAAPPAPLPTSSSAAKRYTLAAPSSMASDAASPSAAGEEWFWMVGIGDSPASIARKIVGSDRRYVELLDANPQKPTNGRTALFQRNFASLAPGEELRLPKAWNAWISTTGLRRGQVTPWSAQ